ncbi:Metallo-hydrolase/oxidoreductase [Calocera cornea HHB12733]|uniref:Metallo-hydrolase/oxidoreductase n=1 Tax=Calocera cornea HHB12733 TaxID=1353952 RepID=A0A165ETG4_9BASI|nr:Metallo-hydrolase/oxidoreductase [Calocera cornea HHB12733]
MSDIPFVPLPAGTATCTVHPLVNATMTDYEHVTLSPSPATQPGKPCAYLEPTFTFYIVHQPSGKRLLFDLGIRWDWKTAFPEDAAREFGEFYGAKVVKDVAELLRDGGVDPERLDYILFSHEHWDHTGFISSLPNAGLVGGRATFSDDLQDQMDAAGRKPTIIDFEKDGQPMGAYERAVDFLGDGSLWLCHTPGHTKDHMSALVRTTSEPASYVLLGGDVAHHPCLLCTLSSHSHYSLVPTYRNPLLPSSAPEEQAHYSPALARDSIGRTKRMEREGNVMCVVAHEFGVGEVETGRCQKGEGDERGDVAW